MSLYFNDLWILSRIVVLNILVRYLCEAEAAFHGLIQCSQGRLLIEALLGNFLLSLRLFGAVVGHVVNFERLFQDLLLLF